MRKTFKNNISTILCVLLVYMMCMFSFSPTIVFAETQIKNGYKKLSENEENEIERGLFTTLSVSLNGGNGKIWATGKNEFTLFSSTIYVVVMLYSSSVYCENFSEMILIGSNYSSDLDMGETVVTEAFINGVQKYWLGCMRYKIDNGSWAEKDTGVLLYSAQGDFIGV